MDEEFDFLWKIIDTHQKFEIVAYLAVTREDPNSEWFLTPKTRDGQRDAEGFSLEGVNFFEAKFFEKENYKLNLTRIGTNILVAICNNANKIYIFSNGYLAPNIIKFLEKHQYIEKNNGRKTKVIFYDRKQTSITLLRHTMEELQVANKEMKFIHYRTLTEAQLEEYKKANRNIVEEVLSGLFEKKNQNLNNFFFNPTLENFKNISEQNKLQIAQENYFKLSVYFENGLSNPEVIKVSIGVPFTIYITLTSYFNDIINCKINICCKNVKNKLQFFYDWTKREQDKYIKEITLEPLKNEIIPIHCMFFDSDYEGIDVHVEVYQGEHLLFVKNQEIYHEIIVSNKFFFTHYFGRNNQISKKALQHIIQESYNRKEYTVQLIKGRAGVGKSRFIEETLNEIYNLTSKRDILKFTIGQDSFSSILKKVLYFTTGLDYISFLDDDEKTDKRNPEEIISIDTLFNNKEELGTFSQKIKLYSLESSQQIGKEDIKKFAEFIAKILIKFHRELTILVFEDLHRGGLYEFQFLLHLDDYLQKYNQRHSVVMLLATRTYDPKYFQSAKDWNFLIEHETIGIYYNNFELNLKSRYEKNIITDLKDLEPEDSEAMIRDLIYSPVMEDPHIQRIIALCGNNPFCIIHTLIQLNQIGVIGPDDNCKYQLEKINKLEAGYQLHNQIDAIFEKRFSFYKQTSFEKAIFEIIRILVIYKSKIGYEILEEMVSSKTLFKPTLSILEQERILVYEQGVVKFEHENLFIYASNKLMEDSEEIADRIFDFLISDFQDKGNNLEYIVRALFWGSSANKDLFYKYSKIFFDLLYEQGLWKETVFYGKLILNKNEVPSNIIDVLEIEMKVRLIQSECDDIMTALNLMKNLFVRVQYGLSTINKEKYEKYYDLFLEIWLQKADLELHAAQTNEADKHFNSLIYEIQGNKAVGNKRKSELLAWIYNRLAVIDMKNKLPEAGIYKLQKGLKYARKARHDYYIHHCYYDLSIACLLTGDKEGMNAYCKKAKSKILKENKYRNASVRTAIHEGLVAFFNGKEKEAVMILEAAVETASFYSYFHEANRGLLYLSSIYLFTNRIKEADKILLKGIKFAEIDKSTKILLGLYSGKIYREHQKYMEGEKIALEKSEYYFKEALKLIFDKEGTKITINNWIELVISNLKTFDLFLQNHSLYRSEASDKELMYSIKHLRDYCRTINPSFEILNLHTVTSSKSSLTPYYVIFS